MTFKPQVLPALSVYKVFVLPSYFLWQAGYTKVQTAGSRIRWTCGQLLVLLLISCMVWCQLNLSEAQSHICKMGIWVPTQQGRTPPTVICILYVLPKRALNMHTNHLGILLKFRFWFSRWDVGPEIFICVMRPCDCHSLRTTFLSTEVIICTAGLNSRDPKSSSKDQLPGRATKEIWMLWTVSPDL